MVGRFRLGRFSLPCCRANWTHRIEFACYEGETILSKFTDRIDQRFPYATAAETAKPGYLAKRFATIIKERAAEKAKREAETEAVELEALKKVRRITK